MKFLICFFILLFIHTPSFAASNTWAVYAKGDSKNKLRPGMNPCKVKYTVSNVRFGKTKKKVRQGLIAPVATGYSLSEANTVKRRFSKSSGDQPDGIFKIRSCKKSKNRRIKAGNNQRICRNLERSEKYHLNWISCCDVANNKSRWVNRANRQENIWNGSCRSYGLGSKPSNKLKFSSSGNSFSFSIGNNKSKKRSNNVSNNNSSNKRVCRTLRSGDPHYSQWASCCDAGKNKSHWKNKKTGKVSTWGKSCSQWGVR